MMKIIDSFLNRTTMYRLMLDYLGGLLALATVLGFFGLLPYSPIWIVVSTAVIVAISWVTNEIFAYIFEAPSNRESTIITALILALIISPLKDIHDTSAIAMIVWAPILAIASKYVFAIGKKHVFNPAALAIAVTALAINQTASWWVGTTLLAPFVIIGGLMVTKKILRYDLVFTFIAVALAGIIASHLAHPSNMFVVIEKTFLSSSTLFLAFVMLTEPYTTPPTSMLRMWYGAIVGFMFVPAFHIGEFYFTPELALLVGNIFVYLVSPKTKLILTLKKTIPVATDAYNFVFQTNQKFSFSPGQYLEWTYAHNHSDDRGIRRYFTIASSPTEPEIALGVKFYNPPSTFKKQLLNMKIGDTLVASQLSGDFTLPKDKKKKLVFIVGGIGVTPFRSMIKYVIDKKEQRDITVFYCNKTASDFAYMDDFKQAEKELGIKTVCTLTQKDAVPKSWTGEVGTLDMAMIKKYVPDYNERYFYISGPHAMVAAFETMLKSSDIKKDHVITDFFPGFV